MQPEKGKRLINQWNRWKWVNKDRLALRSICKRSPAFNIPSNHDLSVAGALSQRQQLWLRGPGQCFCFVHGSFSAEREVCLITPHAIGLLMAGSQRARDLRVSSQTRSPSSESFCRWSSCSSTPAIPKRVQMERERKRKC